MNRKNLAPANEVAFTKLQRELQSTVALLHLPQEKRPLKILETKPKILKKILFDHEDGLEGESDLIAQVSLSRPAGNLWSLHLPWPKAYFDKMEEDGESLSPPQLIKRDFGVVATMGLDVEDFTESDVEPLADFCKKLSAKSKFDMGEPFGDKGNAMILRFGNEAVVVYQNLVGEGDQWEAPPYEISHLLNRVLFPKLAVLYLDFPTGGVFLAVKPVDAIRVAKKIQSYDPKPKKMSKKKILTKKIPELKLTNRLNSQNSPMKRLRHKTQTYGNMALIPAGPFTMGDTLDGNALGDAASVTVTVSAFYMDTNVVSKAQWDDVYNWAISHGYAFDYTGSGKANNHPVQDINWFDSVKWCNARSEKEGRAPAYYTDAGLTTVYRSGQLSPSVNWAAGYRLPTEAEWEKAARGGLHQNRFPWGNTISQSLANFNNVGGESYQTGPTGYNAAYSTGAEPYTSPVGSFAPNGYGLFDMAGNVSQWCWDWYGTPYAGGTDPRGAASGKSRVIRGGGWGGYAVECRTAVREFYDPKAEINGIGFRSVLPPGQ